MKKIVLLLMSLIVVTSCEKVFEKTIEYDIPEEPAKLVIDTKLLADSTASVFISTSVYSMGNEYPRIDKLTLVNLYENGIFKEVLAPVSDGHYEGQYVMKEGNSYKVEAVRDGYTTAFGESMIRQAAVITRGELTSNKDGYNLVINFDDPPQPGDYYYFYTSLVAEGLNNRIYFKTLDPTVEVFDTYDDPFEQDQGTYGVEGYLSDQHFNGKNKRLELSSAGFLFPGPIDSSLRVQFNLYRIPGDLYQHDKTKAAHLASGDGLFSEPVQVYTNVTNGYGIVAGASRSLIELSP